MKRHAVPIPVATRPRDAQERFFDESCIGVFDGATGLHVNMRGPVHGGNRVRRQEFAGTAIQHIKEAVFRRLHDDLAQLAINLDIGQDHGRGSGKVPGIARRGLVVPDVVPGRRIERNDGRQEKIVAPTRAAGLPIPWRPVPHTDVDKIQLRVIGHGVPDGSTAAVFPPGAVPGAGSHFHGGILEPVSRVPGYRVKAPGQFARVLVVGRHITPDSELGAGVPDKDVFSGNTRRPRA